MDEQSKTTETQRRYPNVAKMQAGRKAARQRKEEIRAKKSARMKAINAKRWHPQSSNNDQNQ